MSEAEEMRIDPQRAQALVTALSEVKQRIATFSNGRDVRLVAVSKLKPANDVLALHRFANHLDFGENYAQELSQKAALLPDTIRWHFIGGLQSTHCKTLAKIPNLTHISSLDSPKKAELLNKYRADLPPLNIHVQVNTSNEPSKSGTSPGDETLTVCRAVQACEKLTLVGLMTIGAIARSAATTPETENEDFQVLREQRDLVARELGLELELSMGMSADLEAAIRQGSSEVRVGIDIFGDRPARGDAQLVH